MFSGVQRVIGKAGQERGQDWVRQATTELFGRRVGAGQNGRGRSRAASMLLGNLSDNLAGERFGQREATGRCPAT